VGVRTTRRGTCSAPTNCGVDLWKGGINGERRDINIEFPTTYTLGITIPLYLLEFFFLFYLMNSLYPRSSTQIGDCVRGPQPLVQAFLQHVLAERCSRRHRGARRQRLQTEKRRLRRVRPRSKCIEDLFTLQLLWSGYLCTPHSLNEKMRDDSTI